tara:strand:- start:2011 stop:2826 length:816 start_codon:yes stop_codon:yes gene_type:complete
MKFNHNKKRNTAFIYETLVCELTKASMKEEQDKRQHAISLLKEYFSKGRILGKELEIYKSFEDLDEVGRTVVEKIIKEAKKQFMNLDRQRVFEVQTRAIDKINKAFGRQVWSNFIPNFKSLATVNQILQQNLSPKRQVIIENKLIGSFETEKKQKQMFPKINNLAMKNFLEKFNKEYSTALNEAQKEFLNKYIVTGGHDSLEFKAYLYEEIARIKKELNENLKQQRDTNVSTKIRKVLERVDGYNQTALSRELVLEVTRIQSLVSELNNND